MLINIEGKKIRYEEQGSGPPILFVHGWGGNLNSLHTLFELASQKYHAINIELPGFGESDNPDQEWGVEEYASHLTTFCKQKNLTDLIYFGHSFGGALGIYLVSHNNAFIKSVILCDSAYKRDIKPSKLVRLLKIYAETIPFFDRGEQFIKKIVYKIFFPNSDLLKYPHLETNFRKIVQQDLTPYISDIHIPTLILWGEKDTYTPVAWAHELHEKIPGSKLSVVPDATHGLPLKYPEKVYEIINSFLNQ